MSVVSRTSRLAPDHRTIWIITAIALAILLSTFRIAEFHGLEPRQDHAFMIDWVQSIHDAERLLPRKTPEQGWLAALEADHKSMLHAVLKPLYVASTTIFVTGSLLWFVIGSLITGAGAAAQIALSIAAQGVMLLFLAALPVFGREPDDAGEDARWAIGGLALGIAGTSAFLHGFSPLGAHNVGILALIAAVLVSGRCLASLEAGHGVSRPLETLAVVQAAACYASYTNVFLLPTATVAILFIGGGQRGLANAARFAGLMALAFLPAIALLALTAIRPHASGGAESFFDVGRWVFAGGEGAIFQVLVDNFSSWFVRQAEVFSFIGLAAGLAGLFILSGRYRQPLPLAVLGMHLLVWTVMAGFGAKAGQYTRTSAYVAPLLALGLAVFVVRLSQAALTLRNRNRVRAGTAAAIAIAVIAGHAAADLPRLADPRLTPGWQTYYRSQGIWYPIVREAESQLPGGAVIFPWDQSIAYRLRILRSGDRHAYQVLQPVETLIAKRKQGSLGAYTKRRGIVLPDSAAIYFLLPEKTGRAQGSAIAQDILCGGGFISCTAVDLGQSATWPSPPSMVHLYGAHLILYRAAPDQSAVSPVP